MEILVTPKNLKIRKIPVYRQYTRAEITDYYQNVQLK